MKSYLVSLAKGVAYLHSKNVVHRGLKPQNALLDSEKRLRVGDYGMAQVLELANGSGKVKNYESPEMCQGAGCGKPADVWALGCILYELCSLEVRLAAT